MTTHRLSDSDVFDFWVSLLFLPSIRHSDLKRGVSGRSPSGVPCPGVCLQCEQPVSPTWDNVQRTLQPCVYCAGYRLDNAVAVGKVLATDTCVPLEPFTGSAAAWKVECLSCGAECTSTYNKIVNGDRGVCKACGYAQGGATQAARNLEACRRILEDGDHDGYDIIGQQMREKSGKRQLYLGVRCPAGHEYEVYAYSWKSGSRCSSCLEHGFRRLAPAHLYVVAGRGWLKVGISNDGSLDLRLSQHSTQGMSDVLYLVSFDSGRDAEAVEALWKHGYLVGLDPEHRATSVDLSDGFSESVRDSASHRAWIREVLLPYAKSNAHGIVIPLPTQLCDVVPCGKKALRRGYRAMCSMHATRQRIHGSPYTVITERNLPPSDGACSVTGCEKPHLARGRCRHHYQMEWRRLRSQRST